MTHNMCQSAKGLCRNFGASGSWETPTEVDMLSNADIPITLDLPDVSDISVDISLGDSPDVSEGAG